MLITKDVIEEIGKQIEPNVVRMSQYERVTFESMVADLTQKELLVEMAKTECSSLDALVRLYSSNTLNATQQREIYQKILDIS